MNSLCYLNDNFIDYNLAQFHISDLGLQRGYSIFDYFLEMENRIPFLDDYLDRFHTSAKLLNLEVPLARDLLKEKIAYLLQQNKLGTSGIKLLLTGGYSDDLYTPATPNFIILNLPLFHQPGDFGEGVNLILLDYQRHLPEMKTTFYLPSIALLPKLRKAGAIEVLYHHNGLISETTRANIFFINNGTLITPSAGVLKGITRKYVLRVAKEIMPVEEREVRLEELWQCDEAFITGTSKHVAPIVEVEGRMIGHGKPGAVTKVVSEAYERFFGMQ
jgi:branched-subunit amino acid aminotransferase/4-amino-4-deoxychorismate lyase